MAVARNLNKTTEQIEAAEQQIANCTKRIDYFITEYSIELLAHKMRNGDFEVPSYQRENTWEDSRKWRFIESILMNLPIPFLFFWENTESGKLEIVDGSQRLRTIDEFIHGELILGKLTKLPEVSGFSFKNLPESRQRKIKNRSIRGIILNEHADKQARLDLFDRINTGSKIANSAEIRRGVFPGPFMDLIIKLTQSPAVIEMTPMSSKLVNTREREELLTRFFAYGDGLEEYNDLVNSFLNNYTEKMNETFRQKPELSDEYEKRLKQVIAFVKEIFPYGSRRTPKGNATPRARFESIAIGSYLALLENPQLSPDKGKVATLVGSKEFKKVIGSDGANAISRLKARLHYVRDQLLET